MAQGPEAGRICAPAASGNVGLAGGPVFLSRGSLSPFAALCHLQWYAGSAGYLPGVAMTAQICGPASSSSLST
jgi:hypothetical protein